MVFSSLFFVYFFLALNLVIYFRTQTIRKKNIVMLVFSLIFYSWGGPRYLLLLVVNAAIAWICAIMIEEYEEYDKLFLVLDIVAQLMILAVFKYLGLFLGTVQAFTGVPVTLSMICFSMPEELSFRPSPIMRMPYRNIARPPNSVIRLNMFIEPLLPEV